MLVQKSLKTDSKQTKLKSPTSKAQNTYRQQKMNTINLDTEARFDKMDKEDKSAMK